MQKEQGFCEAAVSPEPCTDVRNTDTGASTAAAAVHGELTRSLLQGYMQFAHVSVGVAKQLKAAEGPWERKAEKAKALSSPHHV